MAAKCTVKFKRYSDHVTALLLHRGHSLNIVNFPRGHTPTVAQARDAKKRLMRGCDELVRGLRRELRRR